MISVLLVDDDEPILELTKGFLEQEQNIKVTTTTSASDALTLMESATFHAIVADYEMPLMNGIEFLKTLKSQGNDTPFIIFTGHGREYVAIEALNNGATFYIQKGTDVASQYAELENMIHQAVQRKQSEQALLTSEEGVGVRVEVAVAVPVAVEVGVAVAVGVTVGVGVGVGAAARTEAPKPKALRRPTKAIKAMATAREWPLPVRGRKPRIVSVATPATIAQVRCSTPVSSAPCQSSGSRLKRPTPAAAKGSSTS